MMKNVSAVIFFFISVFDSNDLLRRQITVSHTHAAAKGAVRDDVSLVLCCHRQIAGLRSDCRRRTSSVFRLNMALGGTVLYGRSGEESAQRQEYRGQMALQDVSVNAECRENQYRTGRFRIVTVLVVSEWMGVYDLASVYYMRMRKQRDAAHICDKERREQQLDKDMPSYEFPHGLQK